MASLTLKDVPEDLHEALKAEALAHGRSLNKELIQRLRVSLVRDRRPDAKAILAKADRLRRRMRGVSIDDDFLDSARREGRP